MGEPEKKLIWVIVPAYNEEKNILPLVNSLLKYGYQIVVVDDGSSDNTWQIIQELPVIKLRHKINRGQGAALQTGTEYALQNGAQIIVHFDGDGQFLAAEISRLAAPILSKQADIALGSRFLNQNFQSKIQNSKSMPFFKRHLILPIAKVINYFLTGLKLTDAHCGFRVLGRSAAQKIKITQDRMSHNTEIVAQIKKYNLKFQEVPVSVIYKTFGQGIGGGVRILRELLLGKLIK